MTVAAAPGGLVVRAGALSVRVCRRSVAVGAALVLLIVAVSAVTLSTGEYHVPLRAVAATLAGGGDGGDRFVVRTLRLPRLLTGLLVGAALGTGGALFQSLTRNPLGSPDVVGFDVGAATGALLVVAVAHGTQGQAAAGAVAGGAATAALVWVLAAGRGVRGDRLILVGIAVAAMLSSVDDFVLTRAGIDDARAAAAWLVGSLDGRGWAQVRLAAAAVAVLLPPAVRLSRDLRVLELGDDTAVALGVRAGRVRLGAAAVGVGLTAVATACAGPIGFVALSAPQIARRLTGVPGPNVLPAALTGALLLAGGDLAVQRAFPGAELPVGLATGVLGGGYLAWLLVREWRRGRG